jgi:mycothiol S-conjugate amidase
MEKSRCLLALHAHPDDESSKGAGTMAKYADDDVRVVLVCATGGEQGEILNPRMDRPGILDKIADVRKAELETACDILGVSEIYYLGYRDSGMPESEGNKHPDAFCNADPNEAIGKFVEIIRKEKPDVVLGYDESRGYEHPDHVAVHRWGNQAWHDAADAAKFPQFGEPWESSKLYQFATFSKKRMEMLHEAALAKGIETPFGGWLVNWDTMGFVDPVVTTKVDVADYIDLRSKALLAHETQIDPDSFWFAIPDDMQREIYPWEDYTLVESRVPTDTPEDDLFAGL